MKRACLPLFALLLLAGLMASIAFEAEEPLTSWALLAKVKPIPGLFGEISQEFDPGIQALNQHEISLAGYLFPLQGGQKVQRFILSAKPPSCATCLPGSSETMVLVNSRQSIEVSAERIRIRGVFRIDPQMGLLYRMDEAIRQ